MFFCPITMPRGQNAIGQLEDVFQEDSMFSLERSMSNRYEKHGLMINLEV